MKLLFIWNLKLKFVVNKVGALGSSKFYIYAYSNIVSLNFMKY